MESFLSEFYAYSADEQTAAGAALMDLADALDPLWRMKCYRNAHSTERLPEPPASTAKPAIGGLMCVRELGDRSRIGA